MSGLFGFCDSSVQGLGVVPYAGGPSVLGSGLRELGSGLRGCHGWRRFVKGSGRMIRVTGVGRRILIVAVGLCAIALGWLLLYEVTSPGVAAKLTTAPLAAVLMLQVFPVLGWFAWRMDRSLNAAISNAELAHERAGGREGASGLSERGLSTDAAAARQEEGGPRTTEVVAVHRVVHVPRARPRVQARAGEEIAAR